MFADTVPNSTRGPHAFYSVTPKHQKLISSFKGMLSLLKKWERKLSPSLYLIRNCDIILWSWKIYICPWETPLNQMNHSFLKSRFKFRNDVQLGGFGLAFFFLPRGRKISNRDKLYTKLSENCQPSPGKSRKKESCTEKQNALWTINNVERYVHVLQEIKN